MNKILGSMGAFFVVLLSSVPAWAEAAAEAATEAAAKPAVSGLVTLSAAIAISIAVVGGALGQGRTASAALEGIARNPGAAGKLFVPMLLGLALIESLVLYAFLIALFILP